MMDTLLGILAPHYCCGCGEVGYALCHHCTNDIICEPYGCCVFCLMPVAGFGPCGPCSVRNGIPLAVCVGERRGVLKLLIGAYKFERLRAARDPLTYLLGVTIPILDNETVITSVPTTGSHIRSRGYDHAELIARRFARERGLPYQRLLHREDSHTQHTASRRERLAHAKQAFSAVARVPNKVFLIDDIVTTGATLEAAAAVLREAGAVMVGVGVIARQPLDNEKSPA